MALTNEERQALRDLISNGNPHIIKNMMKFAGMTDDEIRVELRAIRLRAAECLRMQRLTIDMKLKELGG